MQSNNARPVPQATLVEWRHCAEAIARTLEGMLDDLAGDSEENRGTLQRMIADLKAMVAEIRDRSH